MDDSFLTNYYRNPRKAFADELYQKINRHDQRLALFTHRKILFGFLTTVLLALVVSVFPPTRAMAEAVYHGFIGWFFSHTPTYAELYETRLLTATPTRAEMYPTVEWTVPTNLSIEAASAQAGFPVYEITAFPADATMQARQVIQPDEVNRFTSIISSYQMESVTIVLTQTQYEPDAVAREMPVGDSPVVAVMIGEMDATWIEDLRLSTTVEDMNKVAKKYANELVWEDNGYEFWLQSTPGLPMAVMLSLAETVKLP